MRVWWVLVVALVAAGNGRAAELGGSAAQSGTVLDIPDCEGFGEAPDVASCWLQDVLAGGGSRGKLAVIACVLDRLQQWKLRHLQCVQSSMNKREEILVWPAEARRTIGTVLQEVRTLREEVESLACDWSFSWRTNPLRDLYIKPVKLCRPEVQVAWGSHRAFYDGDMQEWMDWTSTLTKNMIQDRTIHTYGQGGELPEETARRIGRETAQVIGSGALSRGETQRETAILASDRLRLDTNTAQLQAQTILVVQQGLDLRGRKRQEQAALADWWLALAAGDEP